MAGCVMDAAFNVVHDYPGGAAALSERLGKGRAAHADGALDRTESLWLSPRASAAMPAPGLELEAA